MEKKVRIKDIAKRSGVSKGTVDRVIHNRGHVSEEVKKRVLKVMEELNYKPNIIARTLANNRNWRIAALTPDPENDSFWMQPVKGMELALETIRDYGFSVDYYHFPDTDTRRFLIQGDKILMQNYDAVLLAPIFYKEAHEFLDKCHEQGIKYFLINTSLKRSDNNFQCYLGQDSYQSGVLAAKLLDFGVEKGDAVMILHLEKGVYNSQHLVEKEEGFLQYFKNHTIRNIQVVKTGFEDPAKQNAFKQFIWLQLKSYPNLKGFFVTTSKLHHLAKALDSLKVEGLKLVGFDLIEENLHYLNQGKIDFLINQNPLKQGYLGIVNIFKHLVHKKNVEAVQHLPLDVVMMENLDYYLDSREKFQLVL